MEGLPGPLEPSGNGFLDICRMEEAKFRASLPKIPEDMRDFAGRFAASIRRMDPDDRCLHLAGEHTWEAHCGEEAYLIYCDLQCYGRQTMKLPEHRTYRIELIDTWEMTRTVLREKVSGETELALPGREDMAILATCISE